MLINQLKLKVKKNLIKFQNFENFLKSLILFQYLKFLKNYNHLKNKTIYRASN